MLNTAKTLAAIRGEDSVPIEPVKTIAVTVLAHRLIVRRETLRDFPDGAAGILASATETKTGA